MGVFASNVVTSTSSTATGSFSNSVPGLPTAFNNPAFIANTAFLTTVQPAVYQRLTSFATIMVPELIEAIVGVSTFDVTQDRIDWVKGSTSLTQFGGQLASYGDPNKDQPDHYVYSEVFEGAVTQLIMQPQTNVTADLSESYEFGDRQVTRTQADTTVINGELTRYVYGDQVAHIETGALSELTRGSAHSRNFGMFQLEVIGAMNMLLAFGLYLQTRSFAELNFNFYAVTIAISEALTGLVNVSGCLDWMLGKGYCSALGGANLKSNAVDTRFSTFAKGLLRL